MKHWFDRWERRLEFLAVPGLASLIVGMNAAVFALSMLKPEFPLMLRLDPALVMGGQLWRVLTFLFIPPAMSPMWMFFWLMLLYTYATALEAEWGDFRFNLFYGVGAAATVAASLLLGVGLSNIPLNTSIFLAFAALYPDFEIVLFFILPVKARWLAAFAWAGIAWGLLSSGLVGRVGLAAGLVNYALFFGRDHWEQAKQFLRRRRLGR